MSIFALPAAEMAIASVAAETAFGTVVASVPTAIAAESTAAWSFGSMMSGLEGFMSGPWGMASQLFGTGLQAYSSMQAAQANRDAAAYNAAVQRNNAMVAEWQAQDAEYRGQQAVEEHQRKVAALKGTQTASMAARGLDLSEGTPLNILTDTDMLGAMESSTIKQNAAKEAWAHRVSASNSNAQAGLLDMQRSNSASPFTAGATTLLSGVGSVAERWDRSRRGLSLTYNN